MSESGLLITIMLMMIGGAPGSTAGGLKVTTMAVLFLASGTFLQRKQHVNCFRRRIESDAIQNAMALLTLYIFLLLAGSVFLSSIEGLPILKSMFECASALGTVGLTTGITTGLGAFSKAMLISFMFFGRVGGLTLGYSFATSARFNHGLMPVEKISVG
jgi:trk system potassium uptake protein TrkH